MPAKISAAAAAAANVRRLSISQSSLSSYCRSKATIPHSSLRAHSTTKRSLASTSLTRPSLRPPCRSTVLVRPRNQSGRHLSGETKQWIGESFKGAARLTAYVWAIAFLSYVAWQGWEHDNQERLSPTPAQWSFWTRYHMREAKKAQNPSQAQGLELPRWTDVVTAIKETIERLEDPKLDGAQIRSALGEGEGDILVEGIGRTGLDISACTEPWRRGYFDALMTAGLAAEYVDGFVIDKTRKDKIFPPQVVLGPSNPNPIPMPFDSNLEAPREENCVPFFEQPQMYYMKILTTTGFNNDQKLQAALAYGDWLDFKGLHSSASEMYDWALDIAESAYIERGDVPPYDRQTGTLRRGASCVSSNILMTVTAVAEHLAKKGETHRALPAFLTTLRVLRDLQSRGPSASSSSSSSPSSPSSRLTTAVPSDTPDLRSSFSSASSHSTAAATTATTTTTTPAPSTLQYLLSLLTEYPYPPPPPSGDLQVVQDAFTPCAEAAVLSHIGEILYVSSPSSLPPALLATQSPSSRGGAVQASSSQAAGLAWTKQAVDLAESSIRKLSGRVDDPVLMSGSQNQTSMLRKPAQKINGAVGSEENSEREAAMRTCAQCLDVAFGNWQKMVGRLADRERTLQVERARLRQDDGRSSQQKTPTSANRGWSSWLWDFGSQTAVTGPTASGDNSDLGQWINESRVVEERKLAARKMLREEKLPAKF